MSVRMHITRSKTGSRRSQLRLASPRLSKDAKSGTVAIRHAMDTATGMYRGKQILDLSKQSQRTAKRRTARKEKKQ